MPKIPQDYQPINEKHTPLIVPASGPLTTDTPIATPTAVPVKQRLSAKP